MVVNGMNTLGLYVIFLPKYSIFFSKALARSSSVEMDPKIELLIFLVKSVINNSFKVYY
jgi:hypothetical protein